MSFWATSHALGACAFFSFLAASPPYSFCRNSSIRLSLPTKHKKSRHLRAPSRFWVFFRGPRISGSPHPPTPPPPTRFLVASHPSGPPGFISKPLMELKFPASVASAMATRPHTAPSASMAAAQRLFKMCTRCWATRLLPPPHTGGLFFAFLCVSPLFFRVSLSGLTCLSRAFCCCCFCLFVLSFSRDLYIYILHM